MRVLPKGLIELVQRSSPSVEVVIADKDITVQ